MQSTYNYTYGNSQWGDQLTNYRGTTITYDALGNPKSYYNGASYSLGWTKGRLLSSVLYGSATTTFHYNADGIRTKKVGSSTVEYVLDGTKILAEKNGSVVIRYYYDPQGMPVGMNLDGTVYLYEKNLQGDIVGIYTTGGTKVATYAYDAWGKLISSSYTSGYYDPYYYNPFRYRGYYYDVETGFYYLQSRYYDPTTGRFLNADGYVNANGDLQGFNMYAYCSNNPVMYVDYTGESLKEFFNELKNDIEMFVEAAWKSIDADIGLNTGFFVGLEWSNLGFNLGGYAGPPSIVLKDGKFDIGTKFKFEASLGLPFFTVGPQFEAFESYTGNIKDYDTGWQFVSQSYGITSGGFSLGLGGHLNVSFDWYEFYKRVTGQYIESNNSTVLPANVKHNNTLRYEIK